MSNVPAEEAPTAGSHASPEGRHLVANDTDIRLVWLMLAVPNHGDLPCAQGASCDFSDFAATA